MRAVTFTEYGPPEVLTLTEVATPAPKANEILIKIYATTVNTEDLWARNFKAIALRDFSMSFKTPQLLQMLGTSMRNGKKVICALSTESQADLLEIKVLAEAGVIKAHVDRSFPLAEVAAAHRYAEAGHKQGSVVITVAESQVRCQ